MEKVHYAGLKSHPQYEIGQKQMNGSGGMVTFWLKGGLDQARTFLEKLKVLFTICDIFIAYLGRCLPWPSHSGAWRA